MPEIDLSKLDLYIPLIDDRSEEQLYQASLNVIANRSGGTLNDFSDSGPAGAIARSLAFAIAEMLFKVNQLPLALSLTLLELTGVSRRLGQSAIATLTFTLTAARPTPFVIPLGFRVTASGATKVFTTTTALTIEPGALSGAVDAIALEPGGDYNLPAFTITQITQPLAFLGSVVNTEPAQGGASPEPIEETIERGLIALRTRSPVSASDFEQKAEEVLGSGSRAKAIGLLAPDRISEQLGAVHLFVLSASGEPANPALRNEVFSAIAPLTMLGTSLYVSPMELFPIAGRLAAKLLPGVDPIAIADSLWTAFKGYLSPSAFNPGEALLIQEFAFNLRFVAGLELIDEFLLNEGPLNLAMPTAYTLPQAYSLAMELVDERGNLTSLVRGAAEPVDYDPVV